MTERNINIRIAEFMGLDVRLMKKVPWAPPGHKHYMVFKKVGNEKIPFTQVYDYCNDLNAVWEVEEKLMKDALYAKYFTKLFKIKLALVSSSIHSTAKQKCEAIISILEKEDKKS